MVSWGRGASNCTGLVSCVLPRKKAHDNDNAKDKADGFVEVDKLHLVSSLQALVIPEVQEPEMQCAIQRAKLLHAEKPKQPARAAIAIGEGVQMFVALVDFVRVNRYNISQDVFGLFADISAAARRDVISNPNVQTFAVTQDMARSEDGYDRRQVVNGWLGKRQEVPVRSNLLLRWRADDALNAVALFNERCDAAHPATPTAAG